jgi:O-antigen/teichoic acid export membrane protein
LRFDTPTLIRALKFGLPIVPALLFTTLMLKADRFLMQKFCSLQDVGLFSMGTRFPSLLNFVLLGSFSQIWNATGLYDVAKLANAREIQSRLATYFFVLILICFMGLAIYSSTILKILATPEFYAADLTMQIISCSMVIYSFNLFFQTGAFVKGKTWLLPIASIIAFVVSTGGNILMLPRFGYIASAWVTFVTYTIYVLVLYFLCNNFYKITYDFKRMAILYMIAIALVITNNYVKFDNFLFDISKQTFLFLLIPAYLIFGKFLRESEIRELGELLERINPVLLKVYKKFVHLT